MKKLLASLCFASVSLLLSSGAHASLFSNVFIFGDSLSDSGNNAAVLAPNITLPSDVVNNSFIPTFTYASGTYSNGPVWASTFASTLGLNAAPALAGGTNWAFGGARTGPPSNNLFSPFPPSLLTQTGAFLASNGGVAPADALYVVAGGGNNARDALGALGACALALNPAACANAAITGAATQFATDTANIVNGLRNAGARRIIVWDVPNLGNAPAVRAGGAASIGAALLVANAMNNALLSTLNFDANVELFDIFGLGAIISANPAAYGLTNVVDACAAQGAACDPSTYLFWDGIHSTSAGQRIIAEAMLATVPEPATLVLLALGLLGIAASRRRRV